MNMQEFLDSIEGEYPSIHFLLKQIPLKQFVIENKKKIWTFSEWIDDYIKTVSLDVYEPVVIINRTVEIERLASNIAEYKDEVKEYISKNNLPLKINHLIGISPSRALIALTTGYLNPLFTYKDFLERDALRMVVLQRKMELYAPNYDSLLYAQSLTDSSYSFSSFLDDHSKALQTYTIKGNQLLYDFKPETKILSSEMINYINKDDIVELNSGRSFDFENFSNLKKLTVQGDVEKDIPSLKKLVVVGKGVTINKKLLSHIDSLTVDVINNNIPSLYNLSELRILKHDNSDLTSYLQSPFLKTLEIMSETESKTPLLDKLVNLQKLTLKNMEVTPKVILSVTKKLYSLTLVNCSGFNKIAVSQLKRFKSLAELKIVSDTKLEGFSFSENTHLDNLQLSFPITDSELTGLYNLQSLKTLNLSKSQITDQALKSIVRALNISELDLSNTRITNNALKDLKQISSLRLNNTNISNLSSLSNIGIKHLYLENCPNLTSSSFQDFDFPDLVTLSLKGSDNINSGFFPQLEKLSSLNSLNIKIDNPTISKRLIKSYSKFLRKLKKFSSLYKMEPSWQVQV